MGENKKKEVSKKYNKQSVILIVLIVIIAILIILELITGAVSSTISNVKHKIFRTIGIEAKEGNTTGNINNYGYVAEDSKYIYYMCPNENGKYIGISRVSKKDIAGKQERLIEGNWEITGINSYGDYIYFVTLNPNNVDENDKTADPVDNKIHRMKKDGKEHRVINDNDFNNYSYKLSVVDNKVYYIGDDECIWYMNLDGNKKTRLNDNASGFELVTDKYIIYNMRETDTDESTKVVTYIMNRNGKNAKSINGQRVYYSVIYDDYIYYLTSDRYLHKVKVDGTDDKMLSDKKIYNLNVTKDGIFYLNYSYTSENKLESCTICKMDLEGKNNKQIYKLNSTSNSIGITEDWIFYLDNDNSQGRMELVSLDGVQRIVLYTLEYENYYYLDDDKESSNTENTDENEKSNSDNGSPQENDETGDNTNTSSN